MLGDPSHIKFGTRQREVQTREFETRYLIFLSPRLWFTRVNRGRGGRDDRREVGMGVTGGATPSSLARRHPVSPQGLTSLEEGFGSVPESDRRSCWVRGQVEGP